ncbi:PhoX family protein [Actinopolymorpha alba]|uniref:PhoX family protein n=1 Tax=Actinopolymorpha alba TaxID=533267 RepID=UPI00036CA1A4|nr:PhoX family phosphatase [Actinopolymorpha alba]
MKRLLPLLTPHGSRSRMTCTFRCGNACDHPVPNPTDNPYFGDVVAAAVSRRSLLKGSAAGALVLSAGGALAAGPAAAAAPPQPEGSTRPLGTRVDSLDFEPVAPNKQDALVVPRGFQQAVVAAWGDPVVPSAPAFDFEHQTPAAQAKQFGYNCDYSTILPLGRSRTGQERALLIVNHEYTDEILMFRGWTDGKAASLEQLQIAMAAHGVSVVEIERVGQTGRWKLVTSGRRSFNRRLTATTPFVVTGPAAGHELLTTKADPTGRRVLGTLNDCAGGTTPWGTTLHGEENFNQYFEASGAIDPAYVDAFKRYGLPTGPAAGKSWARVDERFDLTKNPHEANRFGWIVELDPYDPDSTPRKRTMLGRFKHEGATVTLAADGRAVAYLGDDERFDYLYKFVSRDRYKRGSSATIHRHNMSLLDAGTLYVAKFTGDGTADGEYDGIGGWIPLTSDKKSYVPGMSVAEVLVNTRLAADKVSPTKMDRPEDVERNPVTGSVYMVCTNNSSRTASQVDEANPRPANKHGHIVEIDESRGDAGSLRFDWRLFLVCGDPNDPSTYFGGYDKSKVSPISCPDNVAFDAAGNLWIATDGNALGSNDGLFATPVKGPERGHVKQFLTVPLGAETCGPIVSQDQRTVFVAVQHPGEIDGATPEQPASHWPYGDQPRPAVACVWKD